jgi:hypothetical protein
MDAVAHPGVSPGWAAPGRGEAAMKDVGHWINGQVRAGTSGQFGNIFNPSVGYQSGRVAFASAA